MILTYFGGKFSEGGFKINERKLMFKNQNQFFVFTILHLPIAKQIIEYWILVLKFETLFIQK